LHFQQHIPHIVEVVVVQETLLQGTPVVLVVVVDD
jgi:hypothetical protein